MPANSGAIAGTVAHRHSVPSSDGGQLAEGVTNFTGGVIHEVLTNDGTDIPVWAAIPASAGGIWTADGFSSSVGGAAQLQVSGMTGRSITQILFHVANDGTNARLLLRVNGISTNTYNTRWWTSDGVGTFVTSQNGYYLSESLADQDFQGEVLIYQGNTNLGYTGNVIRTMIGTINTAAATPQTYQVIMGSGNQAATSAITQIDLLCSGGNILGDLQVNSMDYQ